MHQKKSVSLGRMMARDVLTVGVFAGLVITSLIFCWIMLEPSPMQSSQKMDLAPLIVMIAGIVVPFAWLAYRYGVAVHRLKTFVPVAGHQIKSGEGSDGLCLEYTYQYEGKTHVGSASTTRATVAQLSDFTVLVNPSDPEKSCIQDLFC